MVPGRPVPAVRMTQRSKWTKPARRSLEYQQHVARFAKEQLPLFESRTLGISIKAWLKSPKGKDGELPGNRPDLSNVVKSVEDGLGYSKRIVNDKDFIRFGECGFYPCETQSQERIEVRIWSLEDYEKKGG